MAEKKYYEGYVKIEAYITYGCQAESRDEAYEKICDYIKEEGITMSDADWETYEILPGYVEEQDEQTAPEVINIDEEEW